MKKLLYILFILACFHAKAQSTYSINGIVSDEKGGPVPGATVFITNSKYVTITNAEGKFNFDNIHPGTYEVVIKMLGFNPAVQSVTVREKPVSIVVGLIESITTLNTVNIRAKKIAISAADRSRYLDMFLESFIGRTVNAEQCKLLNPEVLNFDYNRDGKILEVTAEDFLVIENKALGYKIKYLLNDFRKDYANNTCIYEGYPYFEELKGSVDQQKKWDENRRLAYLSSDRHFFRALMNNTLKEEGFQAYMITNLVVYNSSLKFKGYSVRDNNDPKKLQTAIPLLDAMSLFITDHGNFKTLISTPKVVGRDSIVGLVTKDTIRGRDTIGLKKLYIVYTGEKESPRFYKTGDPIDLLPIIKLSPQQKNRRQISQVIPLADTVTIDKNGGLMPTKGFAYTNYWAWERIADLTPLDYFVDPVKPDPSADEIKYDKAPALKRTIAAMDTLRSHLPIEKLYLQTDKPYYTLGDTLWFKSYLLNADYLTPSTKSGLLYIELDNSNNQLLKRIMVPVNSGISFGNIALKEEEIPEGSYTLRAYTNWMRNFGEDYIFKKNIYISALSGSTLVKASFKLDSVAGKSNVTADLTFENLNKDPIRLKDMQLKIMNGKHNLFKDKATTDMGGGINIDFDLADKTQLNNLSIIANQTGKGADTATLTIPVTINRPENMDVQFMPEGGNLVAGITTKVGFKAIGEDGKGTDVSGKIVNSKNQTITNIQTIHQGMGSFELTPEANESYTAVINLPNKTTKTYPLPKVNPTGTALRITNKGNDSLEITLTATAPATNNYYLIGQSRGVICYAATISFKEQTVKKSIAKNLFPTGITRFTLLNQSDQPLNERIVYISHNDNLNISINTNKPNYTTRDSIALNIQVKDKDGTPVHGTFGLAVTDDKQVKADTMGSNILNDLLFTSDLKGNVEEPGWYFEPDAINSNRGTTATATQKTTALDNLLLTQGWVGYDWKNVFNIKPVPIQFTAEKEFTVQGKVTNVFNTPVKRTDIVLLQKKPAMAMDTLTNDKGRFVFKGQKLFPPDTAYYLIEAHNKNGKPFNVGVDVDEFIPPVFAAPKEQPQPWYVNSDTTLLNNGSTKAAQIKAEADYKGEGHLLKVVEIKEKKIIPGSHNRNGPGEADIILDEKEMNAGKKMSLFELLQHRFKNFAYYRDLVSRGPPGPPAYHLNVHRVVFVIDGVFIGGSTLPIEFYMSNLIAEDIKGIEIMYSARYAMAYNPNFLSAEMGPERNVPEYLEITTYSGHGAYLSPTPGRYVYKPIGFSLPKEFYRPRYTIKNKNIAPGTDLRSTVHWEPNVITDIQGKATISFFSADKPADYSVIMEGTDLNGNLGYTRQKIKTVLRSVPAK